ncbi:MAG TPA: extracellular solute-binding protein [Chloroflexota bacterium]|nr:extracellular solute-binding protein [Chloroflexota bacterium]
MPAALHPAGGAPRPILSPAVAPAAAPAAWHGLRRRRRWLVRAGALAGPGGLAFLTACAGRGGDPAGRSKGPVTLTFHSPANPNEQGMFDRMLDAFQQAQPRFKVEREYSAASWEQIQARIFGEAAADVQRVNNDDVFVLLTTGALKGLDDYVKRDLKRGDYYDIVFKSRVGPGDELGAAVVGAAPSVIFYNTEHFRQANVTPPADWSKGWTLAEFDAALQKLLQLHRAGGASNRWAYYDEDKAVQYHLWNAGFRPYNADETKATFLTPPAVEFLTTYQDWYTRKGYALPVPAPEGDGATRAFNEGRLSMHLTGMGFTSSISKDLSWDIAPVFKLKEATTENAERCWCIPLHSRQHEEAWELVRWLFGRQAQEEMARVDWAVPVLKSVAEGPVFNDATRTPAHRGVFHQGVANDVPTLNNPMAGQYQVWFSRTTAELRSGQKTPQEFLRERERLADDLIRQTAWDRKTGWRKGWRMQKSPG